MVNMSLQSAFFPATPKEAMIEPKLKKDNLDSEDYPTEFQTYLKSEGFIKNNWKGSILSTEWLLMW